MSPKIVKRTLVALVVANMLVAAAWWSRDDLVRAGIWPAPVQRVDLGEWPLPTIAKVEAESATTTPDLSGGDGVDLGGEDAVDLGGEDTTDKTSPTNMPAEQDDDPISQPVAEQTTPSAVPPPALPAIADVEPESTTTAADASGEEVAVETPPTDEPSEQDEPPSPPAVAEETTPTTPLPSEPPTPTCIVAGPFKDKPTAEALATRFEAAGGSASVDTDADATAPAYLVYVAPTTREAGISAWQELTAQGIDSYVIPSGARENGVSVGVFSSRERALAQGERVAQLGFSILIQPLLRSAPVYRVVVRDVPAEVLVDVTVAPCDGADAP